MSLLPAFLHLRNEAGVSRLNAPCPCLTPRDCRVTHLLTPCPLGLGVDFAADTWDSLEPREIVMLLMEKESQDVMLRSQLSRRHSAKPDTPRWGTIWGLAAALPLLTFTLCPLSPPSTPHWVALCKCSTYRAALKITALGSTMQSNRCGPFSLPGESKEVKLQQPQG